MKQKTVKNILIGIIWSLLSFLIIFFSVLGSADKAVDDVLYHHAGTPDSRIKIIKIDDRTMNQLGDYSKWDRDIYARLLETICVSEECRPAVVGFDVLFSARKDDESDQRFADACGKYNNVVVGRAYVFKNEVTSDPDGNLVLNGMAVDEIIEPYPELKEVTSQGFVNAIMDEDDSKVRSAFIYFDEDNGARKKSFNATIYEKYMESLNTEASYPTDKSVMSFRYSGNPSEYENVSLIDVLDGLIPPEAFNNSIVLVGVYAAGMMDSYLVPVTNAGQMYGVEINANVIQALLEGKALNKIPVIIDCIIAALVVLALVLICDHLSVINVLIVCIGTAVIKLAAGFFLFRAGYSGNVTVLPVFTILIAAYYIVLHYYRARAAKRSIEKAFSKYVVPQVVAEISKDGSYELKLGGEKRDVAVLFVDIRGFTPLSESLEPEQVVDILNGYLALTTNCIFRHGGTLDKFIGDATMAVFNAPFDTEDYIYKAICTAWDIVQGGNRIEKEFLERYGKHVGFGVGVNCGPAVVGNIGCDFRMDYTAIGDTVNTAARLEANAPRGTVYISEYVYEQVKDRIKVEDVGEIPLKGKSKGVYVYSVTEVIGYESPEKE